MSRAESAACRENKVSVQFQTRTKLRTYRLQLLNAFSKHEVIEINFTGDVPVLDKGSGIRVFDHHQHVAQITKALVNKRI